METIPQMKIKCLDGKTREFMPAVPLNDFVDVQKASIQKAYCYHCGEQFTNQPSALQKETHWRPHVCTRELIQRKYESRR